MVCVPETIYRGNFMFQVWGWVRASAPAVLLTMDHSLCAGCQLLRCLYLLQLGSSHGWHVDLLANSKLNQLVQDYQAGRGSVLIFRRTCKCGVLWDECVSDVYVHCMLSWTSQWVWDSGEGKGVWDLSGGARQAEGPCWFSGDPQICICLCIWRVWCVRVLH